MLRSNRSFDADTHRHCAARRTGELTPRGAMPVRTGQLRRYATLVTLPACQRKCEI